MERRCKMEEKDIDGYIKIPKRLIYGMNSQILSCEALVLYGCMADRHSLSEKNPFFHDADGEVFIYFTNEYGQKTIRRKENKTSDTYKELENAGLISRKRQGLGDPNKIYVKLPFPAHSKKGTASTQNKGDNLEKCGAKDGFDPNAAPPKNQSIKPDPSKTDYNLLNETTTPQKKAFFEKTQEPAPSMVEAVKNLHQHRQNR